MDEDLTKLTNNELAKQLAEATIDSLSQPASISGKRSDFDQRFAALWRESNKRGIMFDPASD